MKKIIFAALAITFSLTTLSSCLKDDGSEYHETAFYPNLPNGVEVYADQTLDSTYVVSTENWVAELRGQANAEVPWIKMSPAHAEVKPGYLLQQRVLFTLEKNETGKARRAYISVTTPDYGEGNILMPITQYPWLNIVSPMPNYSSGNINDVKISFLANLTATEKSAIIRFTVYDNATLSSDADWLVIPEGKTSFVPGMYSVNFEVTPNSSAEERIAHVTLTSGGISNVVDYKQAGKK